MSLLTSPLGLPTGPRRPRVDTHAPYELTYGPAAVRLAEAAGLFLDPWQQDSLHRMLALDEHGRWRHFEVAELVARQNGKGSILEARVLAGFLLFGERLIMWSAHEYKTAIELFLRVKQLIAALVEAGEIDGSDIKVIHTNGEQGFERLSTGQRIKFIARSKDSGRGFSGDLNIIDEAYAYTPAQQSALMPTMSARTNPQIVYASSPPLDGISGEVLFALRERGDPTAPRPADAPPWQQDESLAYRDWGAAGDLENLDGIDLGDPDLWAQTNPALPTRISEQFVGREFRAMSREHFARERIGIWPRRATGRSGVIPDEVWRNRVDPAVQAGEPDRVVRPGDVVFVVQVNATRSHTTIAAVGARQDGTLLASIVEHRPGTHWAPPRLAELKRRHSPLFIVAQDKGPTGSLFTDLADLGIVEAEDRERPRRGDLVVPWAADVAVAYGLFLDAVVDMGRLCHLDEGPLNVALAEAKTRPLAGGTAWDYTVPTVAPLLAVTLGTWAVLAVRLPPARRSAYEDEELMVV
ncbi:hypothetical protein [Nakamurella sp.]|uniref:hypothetical protein n=1 Tax=Nakamurella sp. TaxID=1869182 RepID=UPI003B3BABF8